MDAGIIIETENNEGNIPPPDVPKIKHDWYQTEDHVVVTILAKNMENVEVEYGESTLSVSAKLPSTNVYSLNLRLANFIVVEQCTHKVWPSRIDIKLKKRDGIRWTTLEGNPVQSKIKPIPNEQTGNNQEELGEQAPKYPSSSKSSRDWNKVEKEIEKQEKAEETEGEAAVNALFQQIYGNGTDEVRRAMNKSFLESGGTVLSTNWKEVGGKTVERKPPDGMEWKSWDS
ncbi:PREDICTED: suppressor of G2 allele of SKP1 homolog [Wasmannia auropunctata]|uniref:suppressor of G2 allele of SKP1 homolog n=1 Tax=Wasmannia auropunctata TaxID=64793 RepID=UPI0005EED1A0|nr:PREDICTED: suppressor of G2 allele of SKP1 homolog [Wasmannia auropunctata]